MVCIQNTEQRAQNHQTRNAVTDVRWGTREAGCARQLRLLRGCAWTHYGEGAVCDGGGPFPRSGGIRLDAVAKMLKLTFSSLMLWILALILTQTLWTSSAY